MTSKRQVLLAICETPGWSPPEDSSTIDRWLHELLGEGLIAHRLDGYEATPKALDAYPTFTDCPDIADPDSPKHDPASDALGTADGAVSLERVANLISALLCEVPLPKVLALVESRPDAAPPDVKGLALDIARRMR